MDAGRGSIMVTPFAVEVTGAPTAPVVVVRGEIDVATSPQLRDELSAPARRTAHATSPCEFGGVSFVDSSGLGVLVGIYKRLREEGDGSHPHRRRAGLGAQGVRDHRTRSRAARRLTDAATRRSRQPSV